MAERTGLDDMTDSELGRRYLAANVEFHRVRDQARQAELAYSSKRSAEALARLKKARDDSRKGPFSHHYRVEIIRRLNSPLKATRLARGVSQGALAERTGLPRKMIQEIESGKYRASVPTAIRLWKALGLEVPQEWENLDVV